jgi:hypothetical protein
MSPERRKAILQLVEAGELTPAETARLLGIARWRVAALTRNLSVTPREARWAHIRAKLAETVAEATAPTA